MMKLIKDKTKLIRNILIGVSVLFLIGCEDLMEYPDYYDDMFLVFEAMMTKATHCHYRL